MTHTNLRAAYLAAILAVLLASPVLAQGTPPPNEQIERATPTPTATAVPESATATPTPIPTVAVEQSTATPTAVPTVTVETPTDTPTPVPFNPEPWPTGTIGPGK